MRGEPRGSPRAPRAARVDGVYRFGEFAVDVDARTVHHRNSAVHLEPQAFDLLVCLIEHRDRVMPKIELLDGVWGHSFLSEANLTTRVKEVRRALGDDGRSQHTIRNVPGRGYRFVAPLLDDDAAPAPSGLIGRDAELAKLRTLLGSERLVSIVGPGGVGKTKLARVLAADQTHRFSAGVRMVELAALDTGASVLPAVARAVDVVLDDRHESAAIRAIAALDALLVLDNCEHVIDDVASLVDTLLSMPAAHVSIVTTGRVRLGLSSEHVLPLAPLSVDAACALFLARRHAVAPGCVPDVVTRDRLEALVGRLDRLPLTIEMAAAQSNAVAFAELEHATDTGAVIRMTHRSPASRHRSLGALVAWSVDLLEPTDRAVFETFSVFAGAVEATDAAAVIAPTDPEGVPFDLARLVNRSLLVADLTIEPTRYSMLETVRAVARQQLEASGAMPAARRAHAAHLADALHEIDDRIRTPDEPVARRRLDALVDEARAAHAWASANDPVIADRISSALVHAAHSTIWLEPAVWSEELLAARAADTIAFPGAVLMAAVAATHRGDFDDATSLAGAVRHSDDPRLRAVALELLADLAIYRGRMDDAMRVAATLASHGAEIGDPHAVAIGRVDGALARIYAGDAHGGLATLDAATLGELAPTDAAWVEYARAEAMALLNDPGAPSAYRRAIALGSSVGNRFVASVANESLAIELARTGDTDTALDLLATALGDLVRRGSWTHATIALRTIIGLLSELGDDRTATLVVGAISGTRPVTTVEAMRVLVPTLDELRARVGEPFTEWFEEGQALGSNDPARTVAELVRAPRQR